MVLIPPPHKVVLFKIVNQLLVTGFKINLRTLPAKFIESIDLANLFWPSLAALARNDLNMILPVDGDITQHPTLLDKL